MNVLYTQNNCLTVRLLLIMSCAIDSFIPPTGNICFWVLIFSKALKKVGTDDVNIS